MATKQSQNIFDKGDLLGEAQRKDPADQKKRPGYGEILDFTKRLGRPKMI